jgi:hypothetical protein
MLILQLHALDDKEIVWIISDTNTNTTHLRVYMGEKTEEKEKKKKLCKESRKRRAFSRFKD